MNVEDFSFSEDDSGVENITYKENPTKKEEEGNEKQCAISLSPKSQVWYISDREWGSTAIISS